jgi:type I restriction enzyme S subunit
MATSQDFVNWVCGERLDWRFLKYVLLAERDSYSRFAHGTTHQTIYFPEVKAFHVCLPALPEQRRIAGVLGVLDAKVEQNADLVRKLVAVARRMFSNMAGQSIRVGDVAELIKGLSYTGSGLDDSGLPMFNLANFTTEGWLDRSGLKYYSGDHRDRHKARAGDLLVANTDLTQRRAILGQPLLVPAGVDDALFSHHLFAVKFKAGSEKLRTALFFALQSPQFRRRAEGFAIGTTVAALPRDALADFEFVVPPDDELERLNDEAGALLARAWQAEEESIRLRKIRDGLLPRLISGRIRVPETYQP